MLHVNSARLVQELEALTSLDGRFTNIQLMNMPSGVKRGNFSLVFKAFDKIDGKPVALKFFDLDPSKMDSFRLACFDREHELLTKLVGAARCLQVRSPISMFDFNISPTAAQFIVSAKYFVTDWYEGDIDEYFLRRDPERAAEKLRIFNEVVLAIEALHNRAVFHRDVKFDNFRRKNNSAIDGVVAIDFGTAATESSAPILGAYSGPVGLLAYSAPESFCGMAGDRRIAFLTDIYALGCMLFELFAEDDFGTAYLAVNNDFESRLAALKYVLSPYGRQPEELRKHWDINAPRLLSGLTPLEFPRDGASVPSAIIDIINDLVRRMTVPDFRQRTITLEHVRRRLWSAIRCLENEELARRRTDRLADLRRRKQENARKKGEKARAALPNQLGHHHGRT